MSHLFRSAAMAALCLGVVACGPDDEPVDTSDPADTVSEGGTDMAAIDVTEPAPLPQTDVRPSTATDTAAITIDLPETQAVEFDFNLDPAVIAFDPEVAQMLADEGVREALSFAKEASAEKTQQDNEFFRPWALGLDWELVAEAGDIGAVEITTYMETGGAHPNTFSETRIYRKGGQIMSARDFFSDPDSAEATLSELVRKRLMAARMERVGDFMSEAEAAESVDGVLGEGLYRNLEPGLAGSAEAGRIGGLKIHIDPYVIGPYAEGAYDITVPQAEFRDLIRPEYRDLFAGEPVRE